MMHIVHLETDVTTACQLSCVACNHEVPLYRAQRKIFTSEPAQVKKDLFHLATILHADRWGALGGEPLLAAKLVDILKIARDSGVADRTEVWTNGLLLSKQPQDFWKAFDDLVVSVYLGKHDQTSLDWIVKKCQDEGKGLIWKDETKHPNFKSLFEAVPTNPTQTKYKYDSCFFRWYSRVANGGYFFTCCCAPHMPVLMLGKSFGTDGVLIEGLSEDGLRAYLERSEPLSACSTCAGRDTAKSVPWREEKDPEAWVKASKGL